MWRLGHINSVYYLPGIRDLRYVPREADDRTGREFTEPPPVHALCGVQVTLTLYCLYIVYQVSETYATSLERLMIVLVENLPNLHPVHALCGIQVILTLCIIYQVSEDVRYISGEADDRIGREFTQPPPVHALCSVQVAPVGPTVCDA